MSLLVLGTVCGIFTIGRRGQMKGKKGKRKAQPRILKGCGEAQ